MPTIIGDWFGNVLYMEFTIFSNRDDIVDEAGLGKID